MLIVPHLKVKKSALLDEERPELVRSGLLLGINLLFRSLYECLVTVLGVLLGFLEQDFGALWEGACQG